MRILQLITGLGIGGAERMALTLSGELLREGHEVDIACFVGDLNALTTLNYAGSPPHVFELRSGWPGARLWQYLRFVRFLQRGRYDVVHCHLYHAMVFAVAARLVTGVRAPIIFTSHNYRMKTQARVELVRWLRPFRALDILLGPDQHPRMNAANTVVIPNGNPPASGPVRPRTRRKGPLRLLAVSRFEPPKDHKGLLDAFAAANLDGATLTLVGQGTLEPQLREQVRLLALEDRVSFLKPRDDVAELMRSHDLMVSHSRWEGMPLAVLEAGAIGLPVLSTGVGALGTLLAGDRGFLATPETFVEILREAAADPDERQRRARSLAAHVQEHHGVATMAARHLAAYETAIAREDAARRGITASSAPQVSSSMSQ